MTVEVFVPGVPVSQGSMKPGSGRLRHASGVKLLAWREAIGWRVRQALRQAILVGPVRLDLRFVLPRPKLHASLPEPPYWHNQTPDADKLARAVCDGLTGVAYRDDCQVAQLHVVKHYGADPGVFIRIEPVTTEGTPQ